MNTTIYTTSRRIAGIIIVALETRMGRQTTLETYSNHYEIKTTVVNKKDEQEIQMFVAGIKEGIAILEE